jgi:hypothetical protein
MIHTRAHPRKTIKPSKRRAGLIFKVKGPRPVLTPRGKLTVRRE